MFIYVDTIEKGKSNRSFDFIKIDDKIYNLQYCCAAGVDVEFHFR